MTRPLVSILIPAYNCGSWIAESLASAIAQTWPNKEIIVVDDGSSDDTQAIAASFASQGVRLHVQPNAGAAAARNQALALSSGEYIQWLDADDLLAPCKIESQMAVLQRAHDPPGLRPVGLLLLPAAPGQIHSDTALERSVAGRVAGPEDVDEPPHADGHLADDSGGVRDRRGLEHPATSR